MDTHTAKTTNMVNVQIEHPTGDKENWQEVLKAHEVTQWAMWSAGFLSQPVQKEGRWWSRFHKRLHLSFLLSPSMNQLLSSVPRCLFTRAYSTATNVLSKPVRDPPIKFTQVGGIVVCVATMVKLYCLSAFHKQRVCWFKFQGQIWNCQSVNRRSNNKHLSCQFGRC